MHHTSVANGIVAEALARMRKASAASVKSVLVALAAWADIDQNELRADFQHAVRGTPAQGAELHIDFVQPQARCRKCGSIFEPQGFALRCERCGSNSVALEQESEIEVLSCEF